MYIIYYEEQNFVIRLCVYVKGKGDFRRRRRGTTYTHYQGSKLSEDKPLIIHGP